MADNQQILEIEQALTALVKLIKALRFYPKGHPTLQAAISECMASFLPMLNRKDSRPIQASQTGFIHAERKIGVKNPALPDLAHMLAERRVNQLIFLPDLLPEELLTLLDGLTTPAEEIYRIGGLPVFLRDHQITTIWLNESSLNGALQKRQQLAEDIQQAAEEDVQPAAAQADKPDLEQQLREITEQLNTELQDDGYRRQLDKLLQLAPLYFSQSGPPGVLRILPLLLNQSQQEERNSSQRGMAASALDRLLTEQIVDLLLEQLKQTSLTPQQFQRLQNFTVALGVRVAPQLLSLMTEEENSIVRKRLSTLLAKMGEPLLDLLREMVHNSKWYVVRNVVSLLGDLRLDAGIDILDGLTTHRDQHVRRTLIRSLAMIGGKKSVAPLVKLTRDPVTALRRPAVKALGATQDGAAVLPLLKITQCFDPLGRKIDIRSDAVAALSLLGKQEAVAPLRALAKHPNLLRLKRLEEFRAKIILALAKLAGKELESDFHLWRKSRHGAVQRAAELGLTALMKKK